MNNTLLLKLMLLLIIYIKLNDSYIIRFMKSKIINSKTLLFNNNNNLDRELDIFFEKANAKGAININKMSIEERAERAERGAFLEDEIFEDRGRLLDLQDKYMSGNEEVLNDIKLLQEELNFLKQDYIELVGGGSNVPIYFGKQPDELQ